MKTQEIDLKCLYDAVIVEIPEEKQEEKHSHIIVPDLGKEKNIHGVVVSVGPGKFTINGTVIPSQVKVGDKVILPSMGFTKVEHKGKEYLIGNETQLLAIYK